MNPERKLILLPMDGSDQSMEVVRYISRAVNLVKAEIVLLSIIDKTPDVFWDPQRDQAVSEHLEHMKSWDTYKEHKMGECLAAACEILEAGGLPKSALTCNILKRKRGIARDILDESRFGYDGVVLARSGLGRIDESMLGSVAAKVFINVADSTVCLLGGKPEAGRILVALDDSLGSLRAVNFVCKMLNTSGTAVCLAHIVRLPWNRSGGELEEEIASRITLAHEITMKRVFDRAVDRLTGAGFSAENVSTRLIKTSGSRAATIYNEAKAARFDTIVVGRRGIDDVPDFNMGRVPYKLGYIAKDVALWLAA
ncbi:MAG: universal stress protein [Syntrophobacteraceae bacterium]|nr:universal stress protein [Syntrophobacteraceae bacterium]